MREKTILIVDDDLDLLMLLERELLKRGFIVESAASVPEAEEIMRLIKPDLVLLDVNIQGDDGRRLCWQIKQNPAQHARVIVMSGFDPSFARSALFGADDFVVKPFEIEFLVAKLLTQIEALRHAQLYWREQG